VERHLADDLEKVFHESRIRNLSEREVKALVEDDYQVRTERQELKAQVEILEKGKIICRQIGMRPDLGPVSIHPSAVLDLFRNSDIL
jgi:hypothetical protein